MAAAQQLGLSRAKNFSGKQWQALLGIDSKSSRANSAPHAVSLCKACQNIRLWNGRYTKHLSRSRDLPSSALGCSLCAMLDEKVREAYGRLGFELAKYPAKLSDEPIRVTAVTREETAEGSRMSFCHTCSLISSGSVPIQRSKLIAHYTPRQVYHHLIVSSHPKY